jgi:hypothetical protein
MYTPSDVKVRWETVNVEFRQGKSSSRDKTDAHVISANNDAKDMYRVSRYSIRPIPPSDRHMYLSYNSSSVKATRDSEARTSSGNFKKKSYICERC